MNTWPNPGATGSSCGGLKREGLNPGTVRPSRYAPSQQASSIPGAVHRLSAPAACTVRAIAVNLGD